jgi:glucose/arabinose dehydrogenase
MKNLYAFSRNMCVIGALLIPAFAQAQDNDRDEPIESSVRGNVYMPSRQDATEERVSQLKVPQGFRVSKFAEDLGNSRTIAVHPNGNVYVASKKEGVVHLLRDTNGDGKADVKQVVSKLDDAHGVTVHENKLYIATVAEVYVTDINQNGTLGQLKKIIDDLPDGGQHPNRTMAVGPDNKLYISIGSTCNACDETNPEHATLLQANLDGSDRKVFAKGLRNTFGFDWHPITKEMFGMDHGIDWLGDTDGREELNKVEEGKNYGWPYVYEDGKAVPHRLPDGKTHEEYAKETEFPLLTYDAHSSGMGMKFYNANQFPPEYRNNAFVALRGSWNRSEPVGYKVVRVRFENNQPVEFEDFLTVFIIDNGRSHFGRLVGVAIHTDGSLLVTDDANGVVYRVAFEG